MRIAIEHPSHNPYDPVYIRGGVELVGNMYVQALRRAGHTVTYMVPPNSVVDPRNIVIPLHEIARYRAFADIAQTHDVVVIQSLPTYAFLMSHPILARKALVIDHGVETVPNDADKRVLVDDLVRKGIKYVTCNTECKGHVGRLINQCVPFDRAPFVEPDPALLVACGRFVQDKRMTVAAEAMVILKRHGYRGVMVTDVRPTHYPGVEFRIDVPHSEVMQLFARASCLVHPSIKEANGSCVAFEAAAHGTPVIHYIDNADYFLRPTGCSRKIAAPTVDNIVQTVLNNTPTDRLVARQWCDTHFSESLFVQRIEKWLDHVCGGPLPC